MHQCKRDSQARRVAAELGCSHLTHGWRSMLQGRNPHASVNAAIPCMTWNGVPTEAVNCKPSHLPSRITCTTQPQDWGSFTGAHLVGIATCGLTEMMEPRQHADSGWTSCGAGDCILAWADSVLLDACCLLGGLVRPKSASGCPCDALRDPSSAF